MRSPAHHALLSAPPSRPLREAPKGVRRVSKHVLEVISKKGRQRFVDKPPHDEGEMGGVHWRYCGYDVNAKAHLIEMIDESSCSGDLLLVFVTVLRVRREGTAFPHAPQLYLLRTGSSAARLISAAALR
jgi:hypothetical protein